VLPYQNVAYLPKRKHIRLPFEAYASASNSFYITIDTLRRQRHFARKAFNDVVIAQLRSLAVENRCPIKIYCLMPTHLHLIISAGSISVVEWVKRFK
jgi:REP element-mobilizing transposase RayT